MPTIKVNWPDVETAFERNAPGLQSYIDRTTGEVLVLVEDSPEDADKRRKITEKPEDFVRIEAASSREQYRWMELFVGSVEEDELRDRLLISIDGKGAFRRFKDVLLSYPVERERWFNYRADLLHHHVNGWFAEKELEPDPPAPWGQVAPPPEPEQPLVRTTPAGEGPADVLRAQVKSLVDVLPAGELHAARVFLEYLRDRGSADLSATRGKIDVRRPFRRRNEYGDAAGDPDDLDDVADIDDDADSNHVGAA
jgi:hypothetical protein